jgi:hypothetical protein
MRWRLASLAWLGSTVRLLSKCDAVAGIADTDSPARDSREGSSKDDDKYIYFVSYTHTGVNGRQVSFGNAEVVRDVAVQMPPIPSYFTGKTVGVAPRLGDVLPDRRRHCSGIDAAGQLVPSAWRSSKR